MYFFCNSPIVDNLAVNALATRGQKTLAENVFIYLDAILS